MIQECVSAITIERDWYLEEHQGASILLLGIWANIEAFGYPNISHEKLQSLTHEVKKMDKVLSPIETTLTKVESAFAKANKALGYSRNTIEEQEVSLKEI